MAKKKEVEELNPSEYFNNLKDKIQNITDEELVEFYQGCLTLVEKYKITGQKRVIQKLRFLVDCVEKEREAVKLGINSFVYREDIEEYIDNISKDVVKIIELENYPREIPDEIVDIISKTKDIFDQFYVVFTDYTGEVEKQVSKERRDKDPILFGSFQKKSEQENAFSRQEIVMSDRFYFLGDWIDEYCDLTMDKFLKESGKDKLKEIGTPKNIDDIRKELNRLDDNLKIINTPKKSFFKKIKSVLKRK